MTNLMQDDQAGPSPRRRRASIPAVSMSAFGDGSVRFIKDSIDTWTIDPDDGMAAGRHPQCLGLAVGPARQGRCLAGPRLGNGGEVISADGY